MVCCPFGRLFGFPGVIRLIVAPEQTSSSLTGSFLTGTVAPTGLFAFRGDGALDDGLLAAAACGKPGRSFLFGSATSPRLRRRWTLQGAQYPSPATVSPLQTTTQARGVSHVRVEGSHAGGCWVPNVDR